MSYLLFAGQDCYPAGGMDDLKAEGTVEELMLYFLEHAKEISCNSYIGNWGHIVDRETLKIVYRGSAGYSVDLSEVGELSWAKEP